MTGNVALLSVDNTKTFEKEQLQELYVPGGERVAEKTKECIEICKKYGVLLVNVFDSHPQGHISFASSYKDKKPFDTISLEEIASRTEEENGLSPSANFTVAQLKIYLQQAENNVDRVRPDHGKEWTESKDLMPPLTPELFTLHVPKGYTTYEHPYGGFKGTELAQILKEHNIDTVLITGVATDWCSGQTAQEALEEGFRTYVITDAMAAIREEAGNNMLATLQASGAHLIESQDLDEILAHI